jgi:DNA end-binding protein Ku
MGNTAGRSTWSGSLTFGMVVIPIKLYTATDSHDTSFRQVHREDGGRVQFRRFCSLDGEEVPYSDIAKGAEQPDGSVVVLTDDDMASLPLNTTKSMEVLQFVDPSKIDTLMFDKSYYALPGNPAGASAYALLIAAMRQRKVAGLVKVALRQRETLGLVQERDGGLVLTLLRWPDEVRDNPWSTDAGVGPAGAALNENVVEQAVGLIDIMTEPFVPGEHEDVYAEAVAAMVAAKIAGQPRPAGGASPVTGPPADLSDMLKASVAAAKAKGDKGKGKGKGKK